MEDSGRDSNGNVCLDQIERIMQELDSTTTELQTSTYPGPPATELIHRPIVLPAEIKIEPVDKANDSSHETITVLSQHEDVSNANNSTLLFESNIEMGSLCATNITASQISEANLTPQIHIKSERIETDIVTPPHTVLKDSAMSSIPERSKGGETETPALVARIKSEPVETEINVEINMQASTLSKDINQECMNNSQSTTTPSAAISTSSPNIENEHDETLPDNFFDDLIRDADNITAAALQTNAPSMASLEKQTNEEAQNIKIEPSEKCSGGDKCVEGFNVKSEPLETDTMPEVAPSAPIPENFFDDLLVDHVAERIEDVVNHDLEIKYSERLKELQQLETVENRSNKAHKKHKKKKKKSHKRSLDETLEEGEVIDDNQKRRKRSSSSHSPTMHSRVTVKSEFSIGPVPMETIDLVSDEPETSTSAANRAASLKRSPSICIKSEFASLPQPAEEPDICLPVKESELFQRRSNFDRNGLIMDLTTPLGFKRIKLEKDVDRTATNHTNFISPKDKMQNAKQRAIAAIDELNKMSKKDKTALPAFIHTTTMRKLPNSSSYINQQIYDNRSPLHNVNNVQYKFNSHASRFNLHEWGLEQMPSQAAKVAKVLGFDACTLMKKLQTVKMPPKLLKIKKEHMEQEDRMKEPQSSFLITVATQTDEVIVLDATSKHQKSGFDIGVQTIPQVNNISTQTIDLPAAAGNSYQDLPLVRKLNSLNENQLLALSEFADIMREPSLPKDASSIDLYRQHQRIIDLYKWSQRPSALESTTQQIQTNTTSSVRSNNQIQRDPRQERIGKVAQTAVHPSVSNLRDPRQERRMQIPESPPPPPPPTRQSHVAQSYQKHYSNSHIPQANANADSVPQKIPVISSVQSFHPDFLLPPPPHDARKELSSKYFGRGSIRR